MDTNQNDSRRAGTRTFVLAAVAYALICAVLYASAARANGGRFVFPLDDAYIHLAIAKNLAFHGTFGVNPGEYASATSAPFWTALLSLLFHIGGIREGLAAAMSFGSGLLLLLVCCVLLSRLRVRTPVQLATLGLIIFITPMPLLALSGMEHLLHAALTVLIVFGAASILAGANSAFPRFGVILILITVSVAVRFETLFLVVLFAGFLLLQKRWLLSCAVLASGALPVLVTGAISVSHGWFWLPASVLVKSQKPPVAGLLSACRAMGGHSLSELHGTPHLLVLFLGMAGLFLYGTWPHLRPRSTSDWRLVISLSLFLLHLQFAATGWLMRYEAYLVALGFFVIAPAADRLANHWPASTAGRAVVSAARWQLVVLGAVALVLSEPLASRALHALGLVRAASHNVFEQQFQMARFLKENYNHASVAANDIGAITFYTDIHCLDLAGLANRRVAWARLQRNYDSSVIEAEAEARLVKLAILYDNWFNGENLPRVPGSWIPVEKWTVERNYILGGPTVTFYAMQPAEVGELSRRLRDFAPHLPSGVTVWRR